METVTGPIEASQITRVMHHEHLLSLTPGPWLSGGRSHDHIVANRPTRVLDDTVHASDQIKQAVSALSGLGELGVNTVVDLSPYGVVGRDENGDNVELLRRISEQSGVYVVAATSVYLEAFSPPWTKLASLDEMTDRFVKDATVGIGNTRIRAGVFGEQATSLGEITNHEEKCLRAAGRAARHTGLGLTTHTTHGTQALEQIEILRDEGVDLSRVVIGHQDTHQEPGRETHLQYVLDVLSTGVNIALDTIGKQTWDLFTAPAELNAADGEFTKHAFRKSDVTRMRLLAQLLEAGYEDRILLAQDLTGAEVYLNPTTHGEWGYNYLTAAFTNIRLDDRLVVTESQYEKLLHSNPVRLISRG